MVSDKQAALRLLGLSDGASDEEVRVAYKRLSMQWHPDKNQNSRESNHMMQQLNAAKDKLQQDESDEYESDDDDEYYDEEYSDEDYADDYDPFVDGRMDFGAFLRMFARMRAEGLVNEDGMFMGPRVVRSGSRRGGGPNYCMCPDCVRKRRMDAGTKERRRQEARRRKTEEEAIAAERKAQEEADKVLQQKDPKNSQAWRKGGESRERLIRDHFLRQTPSVLLHEATDNDMVLVLDVPDVSLMDNGRLPPKGVEWEVSYCPTGGKKWTQLMAPKEFDNIYIPKLSPGTEYQIRVRTGTAGNLTWSGSPDWGSWSKPFKYKTSGQPPAAAAGSSRKGKAAASKKKKNRDAAFAKLSLQLDDEQQQQQEQDEEGDEQQHSEDHIEGLEEQQQQQHSEEHDSSEAGPAAVEPAQWQQQRQEKQIGQQQQEHQQQQQSGTVQSVEDQQLQQGIGADVASSNNGSSSSSSDAGAPDPEQAAGSSVDADSSKVSQSSAAAAADESSSVYLAAAAADSDLLSLSDDESDQDEDLDPLAAAEAAAAAVEAAEAAGLPIPQSKHKKQKHKPTIMAPCVFYPFGKCTAGNQCKFQHVKPSEQAAAAAAAAAAAGDGSSRGAAVARLDVLMGAANAAGGHSVKKAREVAQLCNQIITAVPKAKYQAQPQEDGSYLKPLFITAYNVVDNSYAAWYKELTQGVSNKGGSVSHTRSNVTAKIGQVLGDQPSPALAAAKAKQQQQTPAAASGGSSSSSSGGVSSAAGHKPRYPYFCKWYPMGTCRFGNNCQFIHQKGAQPGAPAAAAVAPAAAAMAAVQAAVASSSMAPSGPPASSSSLSSSSSGQGIPKYPVAPQPQQQQQQQQYQPRPMQLPPQQPQQQYGQHNWQQQQQQRQQLYGQFVYQPPQQQQQQQCGRPMYAPHLQQPPYWQQQQQPLWQQQQSMQQLQLYGALQQPVHMQQPFGSPHSAMGPASYKQA